MWKRMLLMLVVLFSILAGIGYFKKKRIEAAMAAGNFAMPPTAVTSMVVKPQGWQPVLSAVGTMRAVQGVIVSADLSGIVDTINFESGTQVKQGATLVQLDTTQEEASLRAAEARRDLATVDLNRKRELIKKQAIATSDLDTAESELRQSSAQVEEAKAIIARKKVVAPFDGVIGIRQVNLGQYLTPGAMIAPLQSMDPIYVEFAVPQQSLGSLEMNGKLRLVADGLQGTSFEGTITAIDSRVDEATRNITVQGTVANPDHKLRPGMFVNVEVLLPQQNEVIAIPSSAISYAPYGDSVYVIKTANGPDGKPHQEVAQQFVKLGRNQGDQVAILSGLKAGDEVVTSGVFKLRPGAPVMVNNSVAPSNSASPTPPNT